MEYNLFIFPHFDNLIVSWSFSQKDFRIKFDSKTKESHFLTLKTATQLARSGV